MTEQAKLCNLIGLVICACIGTWVARSFYDHALIGCIGAGVACAWYGWNE